MRKFWARWQNSVLFWVIFIVSLLPRLAGLGRYITPDELIWVFRTVQFREAVGAGAWAGTLVSGHPGIVTTWLGVLSVNLQLWLQPNSREAYEWITHLAFFMPDNMVAFERLAVFLPSARLGMAVVNSLGITAVYAVTRRLWNQYTAWLVALLLAFDPFVAGLSGILHVDGVMTTLATLALLTLLVVIDDTQGRPRWEMTAVSGIMAALAILSKTPALLLLPMAGLLFVVAIGRAWRLGNGRIRELVVSGLVWGTAVLITIVVLYPALWAVPGDVWRLLSGNANRHIEEALRPTFFMGQVAYDHGLLFYPVVLALRLSPVVMAGLVVGTALFVGQRRARRWSWHKAIFLLLWAVLYIVGITFAAKKFDRYVLVVIPALVILAALGWQQVAQLKPAIGRYLGPVLIGGQALYFLLFWPFPLAAYNPLVGGPWAAQAALPLGWGEAVSTAGGWLAAQPDVAGKTAVTGLAPSFAPFFPGQTLLANSENLIQADYVILTANGQQTAADLWPDLPPEFNLLHTVRYGGLEQAWIYEQANPKKSAVSLNELAEPISFGGRVGLLATGAVVEDDKLDFVTRWQLLAGGANGRYQLKLTVRDEAGHKWASREWELVNEVYFYPEFWPIGAAPEVHYRLDLPPGLVPAVYTVEMALFDEQGARLPVLTENGSFAGTQFRSDFIVPELIAGNLAVPLPLYISLLDDKLTLLGYAALPEQIMGGETAVLDLYWQTKAALPDALTVSLVLDGIETVTMPISRYGSENWLPGDRIHEQYTLPIPPTFPAGEHEVALRLDGDEHVPVVLGTLDVMPSDRLFTLPDISIPLNVTFGELFALQGMDLAAGAAGGTAVLTLYWQTLQQPDALYTIFVHVLRADGTILAQSDHWPGGLPTNRRAEGEIIVDDIQLDIPPEAQSGDYTIVVGVYLAENGLRLAVADAADDRWRLPMPLSVTTGEQ